MVHRRGSWIRNHVYRLVQKNQIGHWCPVCLSIAASVAVTSLVFFAGYIRNLLMIQRNNPGKVMNKIKQGLFSLSFIFLGFLMAFLGISKPDSAQAEINDMKERLAFLARKIVRWWFM